MILTALALAAHAGSAAVNGKKLVDAQEEAKERREQNKPRWEWK